MKPEFENYNKNIKQDFSSFYKEIQNKNENDDENTTLNTNEQINTSN